MIRLTSKYTNNVWYVNPDHIISIGCINGGTTVELTTDIEGTVRHVAESPEEVARKVLEWRIELGARMAAQIEELRRGDADIAFVWNASEEKLYKLAGLEEPNHDAR